MPGLDSALRTHNAAIQRYLPLGGYFVLVVDVEHGGLRESEIRQRHQAYRQAKLEVGAVTNLEAAAGVKRSSRQPPPATVSRGTVFHARYEGEKAVSFVGDGHVLLRVFCREQAGALDRPIRYGVAVTIEAGEGIAVYDEIRARIELPVVARTP